MRLLYSIGTDLKDTQGIADGAEAPGWVFGEPAFVVPKRSGKGRG